MQTNRRQFLKGLGLGIGSLGAFGLSSRNAHAALKKKLDEIKSLSPFDAARDESFWFYVQQRSFLL